MTVLDVARGELGTVESPRGSNRTKYGKWYGLDGQPWCSIFVAWCFDRVGIDVRRLADNWAFTPSALDGLRKRGMVVPTRSAQPGDIVFFDFPDRVNRTQHVGIIEEVTPTSVLSIEGNTGIGNDSNGGEVMRRSRPWAHISGVGRVTTVPAPPTPAPTPQPSQEDHDVKLYQLRYPNRVEHWLLYGDGFRVNLTGPNDVADLGAAFPTVTVSGERACSTWKNFTTERPYAAIAGRSPA